MESPGPRYILTRAAFLLAALIVVLYSISFIKRKQRGSAIVAELKSISSNSAFFQQFYAADTRKSLVRAIALMAGANQLGLPPDKVIAGGLGIERKYFTTDEDKKEPPPRDKIIRASLRGKNENFRKLGYTADYHTLHGMKNGELPAIPSGPAAGQKPETGTIIEESVRDRIL